MEFVLTFEMTGGLKIAPKERLAYEIEELLHEYLENQDYGSGVVKFHIVLKLLTHEQSLAFPAGQFYRPRKKEVLFATLIEIEEALYSSEEAWKSIVCKTILDAVTRFGEVGVIFS